MALRPCLGCGNLTTGSRCPACRPQRGTTASRGYGTSHQQQRAHWAPLVQAGDVECHAERCLMPSRTIAPGAPWDLGHDADRNWTGPEHRRCNRATARPVAS